MRRFVLATTVVAALAVAAPTFASLQPIERDFGELTFPRLRAGTIKVPVGHSDGRIRVIVRLKQPPLAAVFGRSAKSAADHRLNVASGSSRAYLARLTRLQNAAAAQLERAIPRPRLQQRFKILIDGITASVPYRALPKLVRLRLRQQGLPEPDVHAEHEREPVDHLRRRPSRGARARWATA